MTPEEVVRVVAGDRSVGASLVRLLAASGIEAVLFASGRELCASLAAAGASLAGAGACVLAEVDAPGVDAPNLQRDLEHAGIAAAVVLLAPGAELPAAAPALRSEGVEMLGEPCDSAALVEAVQRARQAVRRRAALASDRRDLERQLGTLTPREREVFALVATGLANKGIAAQLGASEKTVKIHRGRVMRKMGAETLAQLVRMAEALAPALLVPAPSV